MLNPWTGHSNPLTAFRMKGLSLGRRNVFLCKYGNTSFTSIAPVSFRLRLVQHLPVAKGTLSPCWIFMSWRQDISMFVFSASFKNFQPWASTNRYSAARLKVLRSQFVSGCYGDKDLDAALHLPLWDHVAIVLDHTFLARCLQVAVLWFLGTY